MTGPILLCFDGSPEAAAAIRAAGKLHPGGEALVITVSVPARDEFRLDPVGDVVGRLSSLYRQWDEVGVEVAGKLAQKGVEIAAANGLTATPLSPSGRAAETILQIADERDARVIVLGIRGKGTVPAVLAGVCSRVLHSATRPVLIIPHA